MKTGARYVESRNEHPTHLLHCLDAVTLLVETETLYPTSAFGQIESMGNLKPELEPCFRELNPKKTADRKLIEKANRIQNRGIEKSAVSYALMKGSGHGP